MHPFESTGYRGGLVKTERIAGPKDGERWNWQEIIPAGATRTLLGLPYSPFKDAVLYYQSTAASTEPAILRVNLGNTRCTMPLLLNVGPLGGGSIRLSGGITINATAANLVGGQAELQIWICPEAQVQHMPPISASITGLVQATPTFLSPDATSLGWCPARRPHLTFLSSQNAELDFLDAAGNFHGRIGFNPGVSNRELQIVHPPNHRLRVNNIGGVPSGVVATWHRE